MLIGLVATEINGLIISFKELVYFQIDSLISQFFCVPLIYCWKVRDSHSTRYHGHTAKHAQFGSEIAYLTYLRDGSAIPSILSFIVIDDKRILYK